MLERAACPTEGRAASSLGRCFWAPTRYRRTCAARPTRGGLRVVGRCEQTLARASRRAAPPAFTVQTISNGRMLVEGERAALRIALKLWAQGRREHGLGEV